MIIKIANSTNYTYWIALHALFGVIATFSSFSSIALFYVIFGSSLFILLKSQNQRGEIDYLLGYLLGWEVIGRMVYASPWIPWESGKYFMFILLLLGLVYKRGNYGKIGIAILLLSIPALFFVEGSRILRDITFNYLGLVNLALAIMYFNKRSYRPSDLVKLFRVILYPIIFILAYITIKTPDFDDLEFGLSAMSATTGNFGSNQMSTILGLGILLLGMSYLKGVRLFAIRNFDLFLLAYTVFRALISFSRGGLLGAVLAMGLAFVMYKQQTKFENEKLGITTVSVQFGKLLITIAGATILFMATNALTGNKLLLRYQGETAGTTMGMREKSINVITTGRYEIMLSDFSLWSRHPVFGVGVGRSKEGREEVGEKGIAAHMEFSRIMAEHGLFGLMINLIIFIYPFIILANKKYRLNKYFTAAFLIFALFTSVHSAMRTNVTPFFYGLSLIMFKPNEKRKEKATISW